MSEAVPQSTIVPPYLGEHWRRLRAHLQTAADFATEAASHSTSEEVAPLVGLSLTELLDANFELMLIQRDAQEPLPMEEG